jgi:hypothetical protein
MALVSLQPHWQHAPPGVGSFTVSSNAIAVIFHGTIYTSHVLWAAFQCCYTSRLIPDRIHIRVLCNACASFLQHAEHQAKEAEIVALQQRMLAERHRQKVNGFYVQPYLNSMSVPAQVLVWVSPPAQRDANKSRTCPARHTCQHPCPLVYIVPPFPGVCCSAGAAS